MGPVRGPLTPLPAPGHDPHESSRGPEGPGPVTVRQPVRRDKVPMPGTMRKAPMSVRLDVPVLDGSSVRLEPLRMEHAPDLARAAEEDRSSYRFTLVPRAAEVEAYLATQRARAGLTPFAQVRIPA